MSKAVENVKSIGAALYDEAPSDKARAFTAALTDKVLAKGDAWIEAHVMDLCAFNSAEEQYCPVEENRLFFLGKWQMALLK